MLSSRCHLQLAAYSCFYCYLLCPNKTIFQIQCRRQAKQVIPCTVCTDVYTLMYLHTYICTMDICMCLWFPVFLYSCSQMDIISVYPEYIYVCMYVHRYIPTISSRYWNNNVHTLQSVLSSVEWSAGYADDGARLLSRTGSFALPHCPFSFGSDRIESTLLPSVRHQSATTLSYFWNFAQCTSMLRFVVAPSIDIYKYIFAFAYNKCASNKENIDIHKKKLENNNTKIVIITTKTRLVAQNRVVVE